MGKLSSLLPPYLNGPTLVVSSRQDKSRSVREGCRGKDWDVGGKVRQGSWYSIHLFGVRPSSRVPGQGGPPGDSSCHLKRSLVVVWLLCNGISFPGTSVCKGSVIVTRAPSEVVEPKEVRCGIWTGGCKTEESRVPRR